jgi:hypothetical protein
MSVPHGASSLFSQSVEIEVPSAHAPTRIPEVFSLKISVLADLQAESAREGIDEEVKELVFVDITVCLLGRRHTFNKQTSQLTSFVRY